MSNDNTRYTITINADELNTLREGLSLALEALLDQEEAAKNERIDVRRRIAREVDATTALIAKVREQAKRGDIATESFIAPAHWATALMYGDYTAIDDDNEAERIERFEASLPGPVVDVESVGIMHGQRLGQHRPCTPDARFMRAFLFTATGVHPMQIAELRATYGDDMIINAAATIADERFMRDGEAMGSVAQARSYFAERLRPLEREVFMVAFLDNRHRPIACEVMFEGTINAASVYPREVVKRALHVNAAAVIFAHNHPSGESTPSRADINMTERVKDALDTIDIRTLDHIVVGADDTTSFAEQGLL
jgi:DNA repair protein RadC